MTNFNKPEPMPVRQDGAKEVWPEVWADVQRMATPYPVNQEVLVDMHGRDQVGWEEYGGPLVVNDGRNPLVDMYQELLDGAVYAKNTLMDGRLAHDEARTVGEIYYALLEQAFAVRWMLKQKTGE